MSFFRFFRPSYIMYLPPQAVYFVGVSTGDTTAWDTVWQKYQTTVAFREKVRCLQALGHSPNTSLLERYDR